MSFPVMVTSYSAASLQMQDIRAKMREMGNLSGVPIEPPEQTELLDACVSGAGVIGGGVPGGRFSLRDPSAISWFHAHPVFSQRAATTRFGSSSSTRSIAPRRSCPRAVWSAYGQAGKASTCPRSPHPKVSRKASGSRRSSVFLA